MFAKLDIFRMSSAMAQHAGQRQAIVAQNVANSDTPAYVARDLPDFSESYLGAADKSALRATRARHLQGQMTGAALPDAIEVRDEASPNGNQVSLETEMLKSVQATREHDRALAIYRTALNVLRSSLRTN